MIDPPLRRHSETMRHRACLLVALALLLGSPAACNDLLGNERRDLFEDDGGSDASPHDEADASTLDGTITATDADVDASDGCTAACTLGAARCLSATSLQTCEGASSACTAWGNATTCAENTVCTRDPSAACIDPNWAQWPMPNDRSDPTTPNRESYTVIGDTVLDNVTHLVWQRAFPLVDGGKSCVLYHYAEAVDHCAGLDLDGHNDWRLPTFIEALSIADFNAGSPAIDTDAFPRTTNEAFWTSTAQAGTPSNGWWLDFAHGYSKSVDRSDASTQPHCVRCVRRPWEPR